MFAAFLQKGFLFQVRYLVRIFIASRRHNFREIALQNCENPKKSAEKFVRTTSYG